MNDLILELQRRELLVYVDLTDLVMRERRLIDKLKSIDAPIELESAVLKSEITLYNELYDRILLNSHLSSSEAQKEFEHKKSNFQIEVDLTKKEITSLVSMLQTFKEDKHLNFWFVHTIEQYQNQLMDIDNILERFDFSSDTLLSSKSLLELIQKRLLRMQHNCACFKKRSSQLNPQSYADEDFLYSEPFYYRKPKERIPAYILEKTQIASQFNRA